ncbi:MAG: phosphoethanolamine transferase [Desulfobulbaceae bacterium]|nr:phosphoethanolamine transferase [Desulfobulbaceae bacterium]
MNKKALKQLLVNCAIAIVVLVTLMVPAFIFPWFSDNPITWYREKYVWMFLVFGAILASCRSFKVVASTLGFLAALEITQFGSLAYSGDYITPFSIGLMFVEFAEVGETAFANFQHFLYVPLLVLIPYGLCLWAIRKSWDAQFKIKGFTVLIVLFLIFPAIRVKTHSDRNDILKFFPVAANPTLANTLNSYAVWLSVLVPESFTEHETMHFEPYAIEENTHPLENKTIIVVMGESLTPNHMSLFGYERQTTPFLDSLVDDANFVYKKGFSAATATRSTLPMFYNIQYNPLNQDILKRQQANLFHLAKQHGFKTFYISAQNSNCLNGVQVSSIDHMVTYDSQEELFNSKKDEGLLKLVQKIKLGERNFIVLHQRNIHLPYQANTSHRPQFQKFPYKGLSYQEESLNAYDNAVLYADYFYQELVTKIIQKQHQPVYCFFTSDHGEELGENGRWGHDKLTINTSMVPFMFYGVDIHTPFLDKLRSIHMPTHYELGVLVADLLGYKIKNPNEEKDIVYINGVASFGKSGYMRFVKGDDELPADLKVIRL